MSGSDVEAVAVLVSKALAAEAGRELPEYSGEEGLKAWARRIESEHEWALLKALGSVVVGVCHGAPEWDFERGEPVAGVAHLTGLFVAPESWGKGFGTELLLAAEEVMRQRGFTKMRLWVAVDNERAIRIYRSAGWSDTGRQSLSSDGKTTG